MVQKAGAYTLYDADAAAYVAAVQAQNAPVTARREKLVTELIIALKAAGSWDRLDDAWLLVAESATQALVSLKQHRLATAVNSPTFTADAGYAFDGATNYINTGFIPGTHAVAMTGSDMRVAAYERANVGANTSSVGLLDGTDINIRLRARSAANNYSGSLSSALTAGGSTTDSRGYTAFSRSGSDFAFYKNGEAAGTVSPATTTTTLPNLAAYICANNNAGVAAGWRAATMGFVALGASLTAAQELAEYNALQSFMTAANGAQV